MDKDGEEDDKEYDYRVCPTLTDNERSIERQIAHNHRRWGKPGKGGISYGAGSEQGLFADIFARHRPVSISATSPSYTFVEGTASSIVLTESLVHRFQSPKHS